MDCKCGGEIRKMPFLDEPHSDIQRCVECLTRYEVKIITTTFEIEAESESEALIKAWDKTGKAMDIMDVKCMKVRKVIK